MRVLLVGPAVDAAAASMPSSSSIVSSSSRVPEPRWRLTKRTPAGAARADESICLGLPGLTNRPCCRRTRKMSCCCRVRASCDIRRWRARRARPPARETRRCRRRRGPATPARLPRSDIEDRAQCGCAGAAAREAAPPRSRSWRGCAASGCSPPSTRLISRFSSEAMFSSCGSRRARARASAHTSFSPSGERRAPRPCCSRTSRLPKNSDQRAMMFQACR